MKRRRSMFPRLVFRALIERRRRISVALAALAVGAALAAVLLSIYADLEKKMSGELRGFGANIVVGPPGATPGETLDQNALAPAARSVRSGSPGLVSLPFLYVIGRVNDEPAVLAGTRFEQLPSFARTWQWQGRGPRMGGECAIGERLAAHFHISPGSRVTARYGGNDVELQVTGVVTSGSSEDHQLLMPLEALQRLSRLDGRTSMLQIMAAGRGAEVEAERNRLAAALGAAAQVRTLRAVAESSARVLLKVKWMLFAVTGVVLGIIGMCVMTTLSAMVLERRKDIAVMKALGGSERWINLLFLCESATLALAGGAGGYLAGILLARWLGKAVFQAPVAFRPIVLPEVLLITLAVALAATLVPLRVVRHLHPAAILKGE